MKSLILWVAFFSVNSPADELANAQPDRFLYKEITISESVSIKTTNEKCGPGYFLEITDGTIKNGQAILNTVCQPLTCGFDCIPKEDGGWCDFTKPPYQLTLYYSNSKNPNPVFVSNEEISSNSFDTKKEAREAAQEMKICKNFSFWD